MFQSSEQKLLNWKVRQNKKYSITTRLSYKKLLLKEWEQQMTNRFDVGGVAVSGDHFINNERVTSEHTFESRSPLDWDMVLGNVARGDKATADAAVTAAHNAFPAWAALSTAERAVHLHRLADVIEQYNDDIAAVECLDMAMLHESLKLRVIARAALNFRNYADIAAEHEERVWSSKGTSNRVVRMPAGPTVIITPWNAPFMLSTWKCAPALAAGNTVILKPAEWSPLSASLLGDFIKEAGLPPGVFNIVQGFGAEVGTPLVEDPRVRRISFTGSGPTAVKIGTAAAKNIVPFTAELGGKSCLLVFADADIDAAAKKAAGQYDDSGQVCMAGTRIIVEKSIEAAFLTKFHQYTDEHVLGDSRDTTTTISPIIHPVHLERVMGFVDRARAAGDEIVRGGKLHKPGGLWYEPTLIKPSSNESEVVQNEVFGPVLTFQTFEGEDEGINLANSTRFGLSGIVYTSSAERAERVGRAVRAGTVWINTFLVRDLTAPFGGMGMSGLGREGGDYALEFQSDLKTLQILEGSVS
jgi:acyl-CoA reductase-like NAD-dependent aldehyde dehydrogenase